MTRSTRTARTAIPVLLALAIGCGDRGQLASGKTDDSQVTPAFDRPWRSMTSQEVRDFIDKRVTVYDDWKTTTGHRQCLGTGDPYACNLELTPIGGVRFLDAKKLSKHGVVIGKIRNVGTEIDSVLPIPRGVDVYWIVEDMDASGNGKSHFVDLRGNRPKSVLSTKGFLPCPPNHDHTKPPHPQTRGEFTCCGGRCPRRLAPADKDDDNHVSPPWITCSTGCCYAEM